MAALLVALSVMAIMLTVAMPVWKQMAQREKEEELVFRGLQYAHAIGLFQRKYANAYPPNFDVLVNEKFLRKKFKDPITNDDFAPIPVGQTAGAPQTGQRAAGPRPSGQQPITLSTSPRGAGRGTTPGGLGTGSVGAGIMGVTSKSKDKSIRLYNGRSHYNEWQFVYVVQAQAPGTGAPGVNAPGQRGQGPQAPGGPIGGQRGGQRGGRGSGPGGPTGPGTGRPTGPGGRPGGFNPFNPGRGRG